MKKYFLGVVAFMIAVTLSSFTTSKRATASTDDVFYWYPVDGNSISGSKLNLTEISKADAMLDPLVTTCPDLTGPVCVYGSHDGNLEINSSITSPDESNTVREDQ